MILLCGKIGEAGMERKRVNNRASPGMSGPLCGLLTVLMEG